MQPHVPGRWALSHPLPAGHGGGNLGRPEYLLDARDRHQISVRSLVQKACSSKKPVQTTRPCSKKLQHNVGSKKLTQNTHAKNRSKSSCKKLMQKSNRGPL